MTLSIALLLPCLAAAGDTPPAPLGQYGIDPEKVTVSGLSSGGYMAVQLGVAYSSMFSGVGVIAAGPYGCAYTGNAVSANINRALGPCMAGGYSWIQKWQCLFRLANCPGTDGPDAVASINLVRQYANQHAIDPLTHLQRQRVFLLSGKKDKKVDPAVVEALDRFYAAFVPSLSIKRERLDQAAHTFPTDTFTQGNACSRSDKPYVSDCKYDSARKLLEHFYGPLKARSDGAPTGLLVEFDQTKFFPAGVDTGMATSGYAYVPNTCTDKNARCTLHVALHGCRQTVADIGKDFVEGAGYNRWADTNGIVVLYPQIGKSTSGSNPESCWDWWGYTGPAWLDKRAPQMQTVTAMVNHLKSRAQ